MENLPKTTHWRTTISPQHSFFRLNLRDIWTYRDLVLSFVKRDFVAFYKQTILGPIWYLIQPLASSVILYLIFNKIANLPTGNIPPFLFYLSGNLIWIYFSENIVKTSETFIQNANIFGKVYFPRLTVPISISISGLISFFIQFLLFTGFYIPYAIGSNSPFPGLKLLLFPLVILHLATSSFAVGVIISSLTNKYRDLRFTLKFGIQLWMFASPIAYSVMQVPEKYRDLFMLNPVTVAIEGFRYIFFGETVVNFYHINISSGLVILLFFLSVLLFNRVEKTFMDTV